MVQNIKYFVLKLLECLAVKSFRIKLKILSMNGQVHLWTFSCISQKESRFQYILGKPTESVVTKTEITIYKKKKNTYTLKDNVFNHSEKIL